MVAQFWNRKCAPQTAVSALLQISLRLSMLLHPRSAVPFAPSPEQSPRRAIIPPTSPDRYGNGLHERPVSQVPVRVSVCLYYLYQQHVLTSFCACLHPRLNLLCSPWVLSGPNPLRIRFPHSLSLFPLSEAFCNGCRLSSLNASFSPSGRFAHRPRCP